MKALHVIREDTLIRVIKANDHAIAVIVNAENITVKRLIGIGYEARHAITVVKSTDERTCTRCRVCGYKSLTGPYLKDVIYHKRLELLLHHLSPPVNRYSRFCIIMENSKVR